MGKIRVIYDLIQEYLKKHPNKEEQTGERNLEFSNWLREYCRPSKNFKAFVPEVGLTNLGCFTAIDLDFILRDYTDRGYEKIMLLEVKTKDAKITYAQRMTMKTLNRIFRTSAKRCKVIYLGYHVLKLSGTTPLNSKRILWDNTEITKEECWHKINMIDQIKTCLH